MREALDRQMRCVLAQLELVSAIPAVNYDASHGSEESMGGGRPPGDYGYRQFSDWYGPPFAPDTPGSCKNDQDREQCVKAAQAELEHLRKGQTIQLEPEHPDHVRERLLRETEGWSLKNVATSHWRIAPGMMRRYRVAAGLDAETGRIPELIENGLDLASRARVLNRQGMSQRQIAMILRVSQPTVHRLIRKAA